MKMPYFKFVESVFTFVPNFRPSPRQGRGYTCINPTAPTMAAAEPIPTTICDQSVRLDWIGVSEDGRRREHKDTGHSGQEFRPRTELSRIIDWQRPCTGGTLRVAAYACNLSRAIFTCNR